MTYTLTIKDHGEGKGDYRFQALVKADDSKTTTGNWFPTIEKLMTEISRQFTNAYSHGTRSAV